MSGLVAFDAVAWNVIMTAHASYIVIDAKEQSCFEWNP
jgi:hypothetical protein